MKKLAVGVLAAVALFLGFVTTRPNEFRIERSTTISAPPDVVFANLVDFRRWEQWNAFEKGMPNVRKTYEGRAGEPGASYHYVGEKMGEGRMTLKSATPSAQLQIEAHFIQPFETRNDLSFTLSQPTPETTTVTWAMTGRNTFLGKAMTTLINMDDMLGGQFEKGLSDLKALSEADAKRRSELK